MTTARPRTNYAVLTNFVYEHKSYFFGNNHFGGAHYDAWHLPRVGAEHAMVSLIKGWAEYADSYHKAKTFEPYDLLKEDYYAGENWVSIAKSIKQLLSMDTGRLDGGFLDSMIHAVLENEGFTEKDLL
mgnify:FL=1